MDDIRYSELKFLQMLASGEKGWEQFYDQGGERSKAIGLGPGMFTDMGVTLIEDLYIRFNDQRMRALVSRLRGELAPNASGSFTEHAWNNPREELNSALIGGTTHNISITYRGLRRIQELRDLLSRDRILEPFGVLLSMQYFRKDFEDALRISEAPISVLYADMDNFKPINTEFGQAAGDVVMKAYLEVVFNTLGALGTGYRGVGDEVVGLVIGQGHKRAVELAEQIRKAVGALRCEHNGKKLSRVSASIGVATTPPESRNLDVETTAEDRKRRAKEAGKNRVISS